MLYFMGDVMAFESFLPLAFHQKRKKLNKTHIQRHKDRETVTEIPRNRDTERQHR